jgi:hypothetical protein
LFSHFLHMIPASVQSGASSITLAATAIAPLPQPNVERGQDELAVVGNLLDSKDAAATQSPSPFQVPENVADSNIVTWDSPHDPTNPHNWSVKYRWFITLLVSVNTFAA